MFVAKLEIDKNYFKYSLVSGPGPRLCLSTIRLKVRVLLKPRPGNDAWDISGSYLTLKFVFKYII